MLKTLLFALTLTCLSTHNLNSQDMDNQKLHSIIYTISEQLDGQDGNWQFVVDSTLFICLTDQLHNRMRIISPIEKMENVTTEQIQRCMEANFHTALDVKYAISDGILWSAFIHPLQELSKNQVLSAISQVYSAAKTFGSVYSSGTLSFPTQEERKAKGN